MWKFIGPYIFYLILNTYNNSNSSAAHTNTHTCVCVYIYIYTIHIYGTAILITKECHIAFLMLKTFNNVFSLILVTVTQVCIKFSATSIRFEFNECLTVHRRWHEESKTNSMTQWFIGPYELLNMFRALLCPSSGACDYTDGPSMWHLTVKME